MNNLIRIKLKPYQAGFINTPAKFPAMISSWGTGKDLCAIIRSLVLSQETEDNLGLILRKEFKDLEDSTVRDFERYTGIKVNSNGDAVIPTNGKPSVIMFRHIEQLNNIQNLNLGFFTIIQADELETDEPFQLLKGRLRRPGKRRSGFCTANAAGHSWLWNIWLRDKKGHADYPCWQATTYDNADVLPPDYVESLKDVPERIYKRFVLNDHSITEGLVWDEFKPHHVIDPFDVPKTWEGVMALDHGVTNPTAVLWAFTDFDGKIYITDEHYEAGQTISYHAQQIHSRDNSNVNDRLCDPACMAKINAKNGQLYSVWDEYHDYGLYFRPANNAVLAGINRVNECFKSNKLFIFKNCVNLIREIESYKWQRVKPGQQKNEPDAPVKKNDHACDALRYLIMSRPDAATIKPEMIIGSMDHWEWMERTQRQHRIEIYGEESDEEENLFF